MKFKNMNTAINQELGRIAGQQHHAWGIRNTPPVKKPLEFAQWVLKGKEHFEMKGFKFFGFPQTRTITAISPVGLVTIRSVRSYWNEYVNEYLPLFNTHSVFENREEVIA